MSRRKQSNPKPLNKGDCSETTDEMTVDSRDSKECQPNELGVEQEQQQQNHTNEASSSPTPTARPATPTHSDETDADEDVAMSEPQSATRREVPAAHSSNTHTPLASPQGASSTHSQSPELAESAAPGSETEPTKSTADEHGDCPMTEAEQQEIIKSPSTHAVERLCSATTTPSPTKQMDEAPPVSPLNVLPKLRLNALLASDPALKPDAKDLKVLHAESQSKKRLAQLPAPPALTKQDELPSARPPNLAESPAPPALKTQAVVDPPAPPRMKVFMCMPCGIGFSSPSTLEAHQAYYCSHRNKDTDEDAAIAAANAEKTSHSPGGTATTVGTVGSGAGGAGSGEPAAKVIKTGKQYACTQCSYSADKKVSLNRHMRMHQTSPATSQSASNGAGSLEESSSQIDRYCSDCDIRFNNIKTYRAHKQHYCNSRRSEGQLTPKLEVSPAGVAKTPVAVPGGVISPQARTKTPTSAMVAAAAAAAAAASLQAPPQPYLALPTNPILIIPYSLIRAASLIPGPLTTASSGVPNPESTCFTLDNSALKPLATALNINAINAAASAVTPTANHLSLGEVGRSQQPAQQSQTTDSMLAEKNVGARTQDSVETSLKRKEGSLRESAPLDLSLRRSPISAILQRQRLRTATPFLEHEQHRLEMETLLEAAKENLSLDDSGSITPEQIVCAPSLPNSPSMSPSPKRRAISPRSSGAGSTSSMSPPVSMPPAAALAAVTTSSLLDSLPLRSMLPADLALKLSESNIISPLLAKQNFELALKLSAAAAAASSGAPQGTTAAELGAALAAAAGKAGGLMGLPVMSGSTGATSNAGAGSQPQMYVKQGVSKCKECNIVFCKYENYLAHKQHYCSARNQDTGDGDAKVSSTPPMAPSANTAETTPVAYQQLICAACGIKYTSLDNLRAHQNYYCPKGVGAGGPPLAVQEPLPPPKEKCGKCKTMHELGAPCAVPPPVQPSQPLLPGPSGTGSGGPNIYKCPVCEAVSLTPSESRKHMETHGSVKAFRCSICRYKGNTLRGMRTHIRMHFDKKTTDFNEEHYMSCILEDEGIEIPSAATLNQEEFAQQIAAVQQHQQAHQQHQREQLQQQQREQQLQQSQVHNCEICNYSSTYKGNVLRHMKLVHPQLLPHSPSISPEAAELDSQAEIPSALHSGMNGDSGTKSFTIKTEPLDHVAARLQDNNNSPLPAPSPRPTSATSNAAELITHIKVEPLEISGEHVAAQVPLSSPLVSPLQAQVAAAAPPPLNASPEENAANMAAAAAAAVALNQKYCQTCDISFNYMKTYLAHKQYYCKNKICLPDMESPAAVAAAAAVGMQSPNGGPTPLLLQKNKENMQQEAAI